MTKVMNKPIFSEVEQFNQQYEGKYIRYKHVSYLVASIDTEREMALLKKANLVSNWFARVEETISFEIQLEKLSTESTIILKLALDKVDF